MERAGHDAVNGKPPINKPNKPGHTRSALILYGSETGNAQDVAEEIARMTERLRFNTTCLDLDSTSLRDLVKSTVVILAISTTGQGEFPQNARRFWRTLLSSALKPGLLKKVFFTSFGLGDSSYARFNTAQRMLHGRLLQLGAHAFCERGEGNEQHPEGHSAGFRGWIVPLKAKLSESFPLPEDESPIADDIFLKPKWKLELVKRDDESGPSNDQMAAVEIVNLRNGTGEISDPVHSNGLTPPSAAESLSKDLLPVKGSYTALLTRNERITASEHFQDVRVLEFQINEQYEYYPGAVAVIYPKNFPIDTQSFIDLMAWQDVVDLPIALVASPQSIAGASASPSPLRHLDLSGVQSTLRWLLENVLDIMSVPRRSLFASLAHFADTETDDGRYQKERLLELANPELIDELWDYTTRPKRTILEVMMDFTTIKIPWQYALSALPMMKGRQFSIASGGKLKLDDDGQTKVELLVAIADPPSPIIKYRRRYGVCTRYITALQPGQQINIGLQQGYLDVKSSEIEVPVLMIGPGTGLAPMRAMAHQRLAWAEELNIREAGKRLEGDLLVFGCRAKTADYFFRSEWDDLCTREGLTVLTAFSRDGARPKQYVQDKIREASGSIRNMLLEHDGKVYVCGSSGNMPKGVRDALVDVLMGGDGERTRTEAEEYLDGMEKAGRYKQETW